MGIQGFCAEVEEDVREVCHKMHEEQENVIEIQVSTKWEKEETRGRHFLSLVEH